MRCQRIGDCVRYGDDAGASAEESQRGGGNTPAFGREVVRGEERWQLRHARGGYGDQGRANPVRMDEIEPSPQLGAQADNDGEIAQKEGASADWRRDAGNGRDGVEPKVLRSEQGWRELRTVQPGDQR